MRWIAYFFLLCSCLFLHAQEGALEEQNVVVLMSGEVYEGNYFASGRSVEISGTVNGDVYVLAEQVVIDGVVNGDVLICAGSTDISGHVSQNCRVLGGQVLMSGTIGNNVTAVSGNLQLLPSATIKGSLVATAANVELGATIGSDATIIASNVRLSAHIGHNLKGYMGEMRITSRAYIGGCVDYKSSKDVWIEPGAFVGGKVVRHPTLVHKLIEGTWIQKLLFGSKVLAILMNFIYTFVIGAILIKIFPKNLEAALQVLQTRPLKSLGFGLVLLVGLPIACLVLLMTILGVPFALTLLAANIIGLYTAKIYSIFWASNWAFKKVRLKPNRLPVLFCGMVVYFFLTAIPIFGTMLAILAMLFGLGAGVVAQTKRGIFKGTRA